MIKVILVVMLMAAMMIVLLGVGQLISGRFDTDSSEIDKLREEIRSQPEVVSKHGSFDPLLSRNRKNYRH